MQFLVTSCIHKYFNGGGEKRPFILMAPQVASAVKRTSRRTYSIDCSISAKRRTFANHSKIRLKSIAIVDFKFII